MFGDRIFSFLVLSLIGTGATFYSSDLPIAAAQSAREFNPIVRVPIHGEGLPQNSGERQPTTLAQNSPPAEPQPSPANPDELKLGDEGDIVTELQNRFKQLGHYEGETTGKYDEKTQEAVKKFQTSQKLEPTGIFDRAAFEKLRELQNIPNPRRRQQPRKRPWGWKRKLVFIGGGGVVLLVGTGGAIFLLLRYINSGKNYEEDIDFDNEQEEKSKLTELYPISPKLHKAEPNVKADDEELENIEESDLPETDSFPPPFPTPVQNERSDTWHEPISPAFTDNNTFAPEVPAGAPSSLTPSFTHDLPPSNSHLIHSQLDPIEELIRQLHSPDPDKRKQTIWKLAREADSRAVHPLVSLLLESDSQQQSLILEALSQIGTRTLKPMNRALALSLQDDNAQVRKNAIRDLTRVYELIAQLSQLIYYATDDPDPEVQETAKWALGQLSHIRMLPSDRNHE